jgi:RNA recognition motif-containing protein
MNIYVGNLSFDVVDDNLRQTFEPFGQVTSAAIVKDKYSGQSRGFGFVEMPNRTEAQAAIESLNGKDLMGRQLNVNEARPRTNRGGGGPGHQGARKEGRSGYSGRNH